MNERIRVRQVRLIDENDEAIGIVSTEDALQRARDAGLDLVEVAPDSDPPVCRIRDFGKWKYEQSKKDKANRARSKTAELKEVRLGRSMKIDTHMIEIRLNQARKFLMEGHKVQIVQNFRGREMMHRDRGHERMAGIVEKLSDIAKLETPPRMAGRRMSMILAPDKAKIDRIRRQVEQAPAPATGGEAEPPPATEASIAEESPPPAEPVKPEAVEARNG
ncbi:MAG: translation initiation factor IF-3 [Planctomycetota bacterium]